MYEDSLIDNLYSDYSKEKKVEETKKQEEKFSIDNLYEGFFNEPNTKKEVDPYEELLNSYESKVTTKTPPKKEKVGMVDYYNNNFVEEMTQTQKKKDVVLENSDVAENIDLDIKEAVKYQHKRLMGFWTGLRGLVLGAIFSFFTSGVLIIVNGALSNWVSANVGLPYWLAVLIVFSIAIILIIPFVFIQKHIRKVRTKLDTEFYGKLPNKEHFEKDDKTLDGML